MPNRKTHLNAGAATGAIAGFVLNCSEQLRQQETSPDYQFNFLQLLGHTFLGGCAGAVGGIMPAIHPHHRGAAHSVATLGVLGYGAWGASKSESLNPYLKTALVAGSIGYCSHIVLDALTPNSVPAVV